MSVHSSLSSRGKGKRSRSVLKRFERLKELLEKEKWKMGDSVFGLPKIRAIRWKLKKAKKAAETEVEEGAAEQAVAEAPPKKEERTKKEEK